MPLPIPVGDYLVEVVIPNDPFTGSPLYQVTREEDINIFDGDEFFPRFRRPPAPGRCTRWTWPASGPTAPTPSTTPASSRPAAAASRGRQRPLCNVKLVTVANQKRSIAPIFKLFTDVPIPGKWKGYIIDDLNVVHQSPRV